MHFSQMKNPASSDMPSDLHKHTLVQAPPHTKINCGGCHIKAKNGTPSNQPCLLHSALTFNGAGPANWYSQALQSAQRTEGNKPELQTQQTPFKF